MFVKGMAAAGTVVGSLAAAPAASATPVAAVRAATSTPFSQGWTSQPARHVDDLVLPEGFTYDLVAAYGDRIGRGQSFGYNNDFLAFFPLDSDHDGLLWVNHEYPDPFFVHGNTDPASKTAEQIRLEQYVVGGSVIHVRREGGVWKLVPDDHLARRITGVSPRIRMTGAGVGDTGVAGQAPVPAWADGSLANCAGGVTPWGTALSAEENWSDYGASEGFGYGWGADFAPENNAGYGWILEVNPYDPESAPKKHTNLGRLRHENATVWASEGKQLVVYTGDDSTDKFLYKFVSEGSYQESRGTGNSELFERGQLYVAEFAPASQDARVTSGTGRWHEVEMSPAALYDVDTWVRAQPWFNPVTFQLNRPEDAAIDAADNSLYTTLTNNSDLGDLHGRIRRLAEDGDDPTALAFTWSDIAIGGPDAGKFSSPDNLTFDRFGNLWMVTDVSSGSLITNEDYAWHQNNGMFMIRIDGDQAGTVFRFAASVPNQAESTGPVFNPAEDAMFLAIQHPGEETSGEGGVRGRPETYTSYWPHGNKTTGENPSQPLPAVVAIRRA